LDKKNNDVWMVDYSKHEQLHFTNYVASTVPHFNVLFYFILFFYNVEHLKPLRVPKSILQTC